MSSDMQIYKNELWDDAKPFFSVITPIYNRRITINRPLNSVRQQTFLNFEYILVDDGSDEDCDDIIFDYMDSVKFPVMYIKKENGGVHTARNLGYSKCRGVLSVCIDSDDELKDNALQTYFDAWDKLKNKDEYFGIYAQCQDQYGNRVGAPFPNNINDVSKDCAVKLCDRTNGEHCGCRVTSILQNNKWPEPAGVNFVTEDIVWKLLEKKYRYFYINNMLRVYYTDTEESYTNSKKRDLQYCINVQWNYGYRLNNWKIYKSVKESKMKALMTYCVFSNILKIKHIAQGIILNYFMDKMIYAIMYFPAYIVSKQYIKRKMN